MPRKLRSYLLFIICCTLIGIPYGVAIIGNNAKVAKSHEIPFAVSISLRRPRHEDIFVNRHYCSGTLIGEQTVLTTSTCLKDKTVDGIEIIAGHKNLEYGKTFYPEWWETYASWKSLTRPIDSRFHDVAVIKLLYSQDVFGFRPITLAFIEAHELTRSNIRIAGWGSDKRGRKRQNLMKARVSVIDNLRCARKAERGPSYRVPKHVFCTESFPYLFTSRGDAGGPAYRTAPYFDLIGINLGICPNISDPSANSEIASNTHLHLHFYEDFIVNMTIKIYQEETKNK